MVNINQVSINTNNIIYKTSVYQIKFEINKSNLIDNNYFNLEKLDNLRIINNGFLRFIRKKNNKTRSEMANILKVPIYTWIGWEFYNKAMPYNQLIKITKSFNISTKDLYKLIKDSEFTFGIHHGKNRLKLPLKEQDFKLVKYLIPMSHNKTYLIKDTPIEIKNKVINSFSVDKYNYNKSGLIILYSYLLNRFLKTFYTHKKEIHLNFPLTKEVQLWITKKVDLRCAVIIPLLLSDGGEIPTGVSLSGNNDIAHQIFTDAWFYSFNKLPSSFKIRSGKVNVTKYILSKEFMQNLKDVCPSFKKSPKNENLHSYLESIQPTINYLFDRPKLEQQIALKLWFITEGSVSISLDKKRGLINPALRIACAHPKLANELKLLAKDNGINLSIKRGDHYWSGIHGLQSTSISSAINFLKIGGFIRGVNVSHKGNSSFTGFDKQDLLLGILEFIVRQRTNNKYKNNNIKEINKQVYNIIKKKEFKNEAYYIKFFGDKRC